MPDPDSTCKKLFKCGGVVFAAIIILFAVLLGNSLHVVEEGHVGVYFRNGALMVSLLQGHIAVPTKLIFVK